MIYVNEIIQNFAEEMREHFGLICVGDGGRMPYNVEEITVIFHSCQRVTIEQARELIVKSTERLTRMVNEHEKIRPFLKEYPFGFNRSDVRISFVKRNHESYADGSVAYVFQARNNIYYDRKDPKTEELIDLLKEPYQEAFEKVQKQPSSLHGQSPIVNKHWYNASNH